MKVSAYVSDVFVLMMFASLVIYMWNSGFKSEPNIFVLLLAIPGITMLVYSQLWAKQNLSWPKDPLLDNFNKI